MYTANRVNCVWPLQVGQQVVPLSLSLRARHKTPTRKKWPREILGQVFCVSLYRLSERGTTCSLLTSGFCGQASGFFACPTGRGSFSMGCSLNGWGKTFQPFKQLLLSVWKSLHPFEQLMLFIGKKSSSVWTAEVICSKRIFICSKAEVIHSKKRSLHKFKDLR